MARGGSRQPEGSLCDEEFFSEVWENGDASVKVEAMTTALGANRPLSTLNR